MVREEHARNMDRLVLQDVAPAAWDEFHAGRTGHVGQPLAACWARAQLLGAPREGAAVDDALLGGEALRLHAGQLELIEAIGDSILDRATARVADRDFLLLLADCDGVVVRTSGGGAFAEAANRMRLIAGACWSESARGTNAIGTAVPATLPTEDPGPPPYGRGKHEHESTPAPN